MEVYRRDRHKIVLRNGEVLQVSELLSARELPVIEVGTSEYARSR